MSATQHYQAQGSVRAGGTGRLEAHGLDTPFDGTAGRLDELPGPADVLSAALCACILKNVERFSHMLPFPYESATVKVVAEREAPPPHIRRMHYELEIVTDEPPPRVDLLHRNIQKFGTITNTFEQGVRGDRDHPRRAEGSCCAVSDTTAGPRQLHRSN